MLDFIKNAYVWKGVCKDGGAENKFGQVGHEGRMFMLRSMLNFMFYQIFVTAIEDGIRQVKNRGPDMIRRLVQSTGE